MQLKSVIVNGERYAVPKDRHFIIPGDSDSIEVIPEILNYSINNPYISLYLNGIDEHPNVMTQNELASVIYSNIPSGKYDFHISLFGESYVYEHEPVSGFDGSAKIELSIGLDIGVNFISKYLFRLSIEPEIGVRASLEGVGENEYKRHNCSNCVSVQCCLFGRVTFHVYLCGYDYNNKEDTEDEVSEVELEDSTEPKEFHITNFVIYDGPCENLSHKIKLRAYEIGADGNISGIVKDASYYIKTSKFDYVKLSSKADEDILENSDGSIEVWLSDKILTDEKCVILAKSGTGAKGKIAVGSSYDPTLERMNEFDIILDNDKIGRALSSCCCRADPARP